MDCAPLLANLYLFHFEYIYMRKLSRSNMCKARSFCTTLNNSSFESVINEIYPSELILKKTTQNCGIVSYLDVGIMVRNGHFTTTIFDKRESFNFRIVNFPFMSSNISAVPSYGSYMSQLVRIERICSTYNEFVKQNMAITIYKIDETRVLSQEVGWQF